MTAILAVDFGNGGPDLINDVANQYINAINSGFGLIKGDVTWILNVLIILSIMWSAALWALSDDHVIAHFARKIVYIGFFAWIIQNWQSLTDKLASSFMNLGLKAGGFDGASYYTSQPGNSGCASDQVEMIDDADAVLLLQLGEHCCGVKAANAATVES
jgi:type IV secretion system protein TrbL